MAASFFAKTVPSAAYCRRSITERLARPAVSGKAPGWLNRYQARTQRSSCSVWVLFPLPSSICFSRVSTRRS